MRASEIRTITKNLFNFLINNRERALQIAADSD